MSRVLRWGRAVFRKVGTNSSGFKSYGQFNPDKQSGLVIFTNSDNGYPLREAVVKQIGDL